jgi:hypothetical protein
VHDRPVTRPGRSCHAGDRTFRDAKPAAAEGA